MILRHGARSSRALLALALLASVSCSIVNGVTRGVGRGVQTLYPAGREALTQAELRSALIDFSASFSVLVTEAADRIALGTNAPRLRRLALLWKIRMPPAIQLAVADSNPRTGYVETLTVTVAQRQYFEDGAGKTLFGEQQSIALDTAKEIERNALALGKSFLPPDKLDALQKSVEQLAREHPLRGEFLREGMQAGLQKAETGGVFDEIIGLPMAPFRAIAGVESTAQAVHEFNATAAQFTDVVEQAPERVRWQLELLSYDLQEQGGVLEQSLGAFNLAAQSMDRLSLAAEKAPEDVRLAVHQAAEEIDRNNAALRLLLADFRAALAETGTTARDVAGLMESLERTSVQVNQAGVAWSGLIAELNAPSPPPPPGSDPPRPFDILDYEKTAIAIQATATDLRALMAEIERTGNGISSAVADRFLRNGLILIAAFFVALLGYRFVAARIAPTR